MWGSPTCYRFNFARIGASPYIRPGKGLDATASYPELGQQLNADDGPGHQQNHIVDALQPAERARLFPHLQLVQGPLGAVLCEPPLHSVRKKCCVVRCELAHPTPFCELCPSISDSARSQSSSSPPGANPRLSASRNATTAIRSCRCSAGDLVSMRECCSIRFSGLSGFPGLFSPFGSGGDHCEDFSFVGLFDICLSSTRLAKKAQAPMAMLRYGSCG
jgi:hypothetical protein